MNLFSFSADAPIIVQGMTGKEGMRMASWMMASGTNVVAGVTPGKGGQEILGRSIFGSVSEALINFPSVVASCIAVPAAHVRSATEEAFAAGIKFVHILSEQVPVHDVIALRSAAQKQHASLLGPSSVGYLQFPALRLGYLGGERPFEKLCLGDLVVLSTSGGMTNELIMALARGGVGIRAAVALGGDRVTGITVDEAVSLAEDASSVRQIALFVEPGHPWLEAVTRGSFVPRKPTVIFLAGEVLDVLPRGVPYGHTGTLLGEGAKTVRELRLEIRARGMACVSTVDDFVLECQRLCQT